MPHIHFGLLLIGIFIVFTTPSKVAKNTWLITIGMCIIAILLWYMPSEQIRVRQNDLVGAISVIEKR